MPRKEVPEAPETTFIDLEIGKPYVFQKGEGLRQIDTSYGTRAAFGAHAFDETGYVGHVNVFWAAVSRQLDEALKADDDLLGGVVVNVEREKGQDRYELRPYEGIDKLYEIAESMLAADSADTPEDAPF